MDRFIVWKAEIRTSNFLIRMLAILLAGILCINSLRIGVWADEPNYPELLSEACVLMEGSTGTILYEKNATKELRPASITKIMTLLLIFEALDRGDISLDDSVSVSEHAASMGGSQVYLEPNEKQDVNTLIKCISIASANDASVAMAEYIAGSELAFVKRMNERAKELNMNHTNFVNCYGLDTDGHYSCALDVALMSRELIMNHLEISNYSTVWMDHFYHHTAKGNTEFGLTNTNKLIRSYSGITGLKTGSTGLAKYCLSATAKRDGMDLIAVIMAAPDTKHRFSEARALLDYGFANYELYCNDFTEWEPEPLMIKHGKFPYVEGIPESKFIWLHKKSVPEDIRFEIVYHNDISAPFEMNTEIGNIFFYSGDKEIGKVALLSKYGIERATFADCLSKVWLKFLDINKEN